MQDLSTYSDSQLVELLPTGGDRVFMEIFERYNGVLYAFAYRKLGDRQEAQDVVQEVFATLWEKRESFVLKTYLSGYLYKSVLNRVLNIFKHHKVVLQYADAAKLDIDVDSAQTDYLIREKEITARIEREIAAMPPRMREVYELKHRKFRSVKEIAAELEISEHTVSNHLKAASGHLRDRLGLLIFVLYLLEK